MKTLIENGRIIDPASQFNNIGSVAIAQGRVVSVGQPPTNFSPDKRIDASGLWVIPGIFDLCARLSVAGHSHAGMLSTEMQAAVAGGVTSLVCPPDMGPILDSSDQVEMLQSRTQQLFKSRMFPIGALTQGLKGEAITEMSRLAQAGCISFGQGETPLRNILSLQRAMQYANTFGFSLWLRAQDAALGEGIAASGALAQRMGLTGIPVAAETIALNTILELLRESPCRLHICRISSARAVNIIRQAKAEGLNISCDVSINSLLLTDMDIGYFDSRARLSPPLRQARDREALSEALADGTIDALVSDHTPVVDDLKNVPFAEATPGASGLELLLPLAHKWAQESQVPICHALERITSTPAQIASSTLSISQKKLGQLSPNSVADICLYDPNASWQVKANQFHSQSHFTLFDGWHMLGKIQTTFINGEPVFLNTN